MNTAYYYSLLELKHDATLNELKKAFRLKAKEYHPDISLLPNAHERFIEINEAYEYIKNKIELDLSLKGNQSDNTDETAQDIINKWMAGERERIRKRAAQNAKMSYRAYKKTKAYKTTEIMSKGLLVAALLLGILVTSGSVFGTLFQYNNNPKMVDINYISRSVIIFLTGVIMMAYSSYKIGNEFWQKHRLK
jgi:hypothetical protein